MSDVFPPVNAQDTEVAPSSIDSHDQDYAGWQAYKATQVKERERQEAAKQERADMGLPEHVVVPTENDNPFEGQ
jgi:hypothetical protein